MLSTIKRIVQHIENDRFMIKTTFIETNKES
ncbi:integrase, partial [Escherichia coli]|nr:integrase [Escherichia coli]